MSSLFRNSKNLESALLKPQGISSTDANFSLFFVCYLLFSKSLNFSSLPQNYVKFLYLCRVKSFGVFPLHVYTQQGSLLHSILFDFVGASKEPLGLVTSITTKATGYLATEYQAIGPTPLKPKMLALMPTTPKHFYSSDPQLVSYWQRDKYYIRRVTKKETFMSGQAVKKLNLAFMKHYLPFNRVTNSLLPYKKKWRFRRENYKKRRYFAVFTEAKPLFKFIRRKRRKLFLHKMSEYIRKLGYRMNDGRALYLRSYKNFYYGRTRFTFQNLAEAKQQVVNAPVARSGFLPANKFSYVYKDVKKFRFKITRRLFITKLQKKMRLQQFFRYAQARDRGNWYRPFGKFVVFANRHSLYDYYHDCINVRKRTKPVVKHVLNWLSKYKSDLDFKLDRRQRQYWRFVRKYNASVKVTTLRNNIFLLARVGNNVISFRTGLFEELKHGTKRKRTQLTGWYLSDKFSAEVNFFIKPKTTFFVDFFGKTASRSGIWNSWKHSNNWRFARICSATPTAFNGTKARRKRRL